jgi:hypothetical protein
LSGNLFCSVAIGVRLMFVQGELPPGQRPVGFSRWCNRLGRIRSFFWLLAEMSLCYTCIIKLEGSLSWDLFCKALVKECAQDFVAYFAPNALYVGMRETQLQTRVDGLLDSREIRGDIVLEAELVGKHFFVDIEWQSTKDTKMDERLLGYSCEITRTQGRNVLPCVIYTQPVSKIPQAPLERSIPINRAPGERPMIWFDFESLDLCNTPVEDLRALNLDAFCVLMLLCEDGGTPAILEEILERLLKNLDKRKESIAAAFFFAGKVLTSEEERAFLERRYLMIDDLLKDNWVYQRMLSEGREEGREEGRVEEARQNIELFVEKRFPTLLAWVKARVEQMSDLETLQRIVSALFTANTEEEIKASFSV